MKKLYNISILIFILFISYNVSSQQNILSKLKEIAFVEHIYVKTFKKQIVIEYILLKIYYLLRQYTYCL